MTELELTVCKRNCLECGVGAEVLLVLNDPTKLVVNVGLEVADYYRVITATITEIVYTCTTVVYTVEYDETLLVDPETPLVYTDIRSYCCSSCYGLYIREVVRAAIAAHEEVL